jgi:hypothetical protein
MRSTRRTYPGVLFARYCDDVIVHAASERQARLLRDAIASRLAECGLELNERKTRIVYCKDSDRRGSYEHESFDFLGYRFRPRLSRSKSGGQFVNFLPAVSDDARQRMRREVRRWRLHLVRTRPSPTWRGSSIRSSRAGSTTTGASTARCWPRFSGASTRISCVGPNASTNGCAATPPRRAGSWSTSSDANPGCSPTGGLVCAPTAGRWEPGERRRSRRVLREPGGETPPGHSPGRVGLPTGDARCIAKASHHPVKALTTRPLRA